MNRQVATPWGARASPGSRRRQKSKPMKTKTFSLIELLTVIAIVAVLGILTTPRACAQVDAFTVTSLTTSTNAVAASTTAAVTTPAIEVRGDQGVGFVTKFNVDGPSTGNVTFHYNVSADGTNWTTTKPLNSGAIAANGTNSVTAYYNFGPTDSAELRNIRYIKLSEVQNAATNAVSLQSLWSTKFNR